MVGSAEHLARREISMLELFATILAGSGVAMLVAGVFVVLFGLGRGD
jgi:hypothetical protein